MLINLWGHLSYFIKDFSLYLILLITSTIVLLFLILKIHKSQASNNKKNMFLLIIFTLLSFFYIYSAFEAYFRYRFDESDSLGFLRVTQRWTQRHVVYNNYQYRDRDFKTEKEQGRVRIGVMGDSNAFGYGIKNVSNRFSNILENKLKSNGYNAEVYNFAVPGFDTDQEVNEYQRVKHLSFDILVWAYFLNDIEEESNSAGQKVLQSAQKPPSGLISFLSDNSFFFNYIYWRLDARYDKTFLNIRNADLSQYSDSGVFNHHKNIIDSFTKSLEDSGKKVVVVILPFFYFFPDYPQTAVDIHHRMDKIFADDGAGVVDMMNFVKDKNKFDLVVGSYDSHPNEYVHRLIADKLYNAISPLLEKNGSNTTVKR